MNKASLVVSSAEKLAAMLGELEASDTYHIESVKLEITEQIYLTMQEFDIGNAELARRLGKSRQYVTKILQGTANFTIESLVKIARALNCNLDFRLSPRQEKGLLEDYQAALASMSKTKDKRQRILRLVYSEPLTTKELPDERFASAA
jgi:transcriptional regulator with XRE-family HTH domain